MAALGDYDDNPTIEPRPCGQCLQFNPDEVDNGEGFGTCAYRGHSVTRRMRVVLRRGETSCFMPMPGELR